MLEPVWGSAADTGRGGRGGLGLGVWWPGSALGAAAYWFHGFWVTNLNSLSLRTSSKMNRVLPTSWGLSAMVPVKALCKIHSRCPGELGKQSPGNPDLPGGQLGQTHRSIRAKDWEASWRARPQRRQQPLAREEER